jgi:hypothetical protein
MFAGHLAVALGARTIEPRPSLGALVAATYALDLLWPLFLLLGIETVRIHPGDTAFTNLEFTRYPWSHSLLVVLMWGLAGAATAWIALRHRRAALIIGAVIISHWLLDFVTHRPDLPLWPDGPKVGLGVWNSVAGTILVEGLLYLGAIAVYVRATKPRDRAGSWALWSLLIFVGLIWISSPWQPPPPSERAVAFGGLAGFLLPVWAHWADRHRDRR